MSKIRSVAAAIVCAAIEAYQTRSRSAPAHALPMANVRTTVLKAVLAGCLIRTLDQTVKSTL